ncbi:hypothetical protein [Ornithinibacillus xuwenensis]|uniref:Uncharacterized protein n=1 Tax=Ornithinibacillus xuwenensis TaxID=3144668 RepID=A0ABU9XBM3_9BACI
MDFKEFLPSDKDKANREVACIEHCKIRVAEHYKNGRYIEAVAFHINIARSLEALDRLKQNKIEHDQQFMLKRLDAQLVVDKQIYELKVKTHAAK